MERKLATRVAQRRQVGGDCKTTHPVGASWMMLMSLEEATANMW